MKKILGSLVIMGLLANAILAGEIGINIYGLSYHFKKSESYHNAPRSVFDSDGQYVYNPGIGLDYDFRKKGAVGLSGYLTVGWFQDCGDYPFYIAGAGLRYKNHFWRTNHWFWEVNIVGVVANAEDWDIDDNGNAISYGRETTFLPVANIGFGYQFDNKQFIKYQVTYVPENNDIGGTSGTDLLFMWITYGF